MGGMCRNGLIGYIIMHSDFFSDSFFVLLHLAIPLEICYHWPSHTLVQHVQFLRRWVN